MNEEIILSMVSPYVKDGSITYDQFDVMSICAIKKRLVRLQFIMER